MTDENKPMYAVKRVHCKTKAVEWFAIEHDGTHYWTDDLGKRELMIAKPDLCGFNRYADFRHAIVTANVRRQRRTPKTILPNECLLYDLKSHDLFVVAPARADGRSEMTCIGTSFEDVFKYLRHKRL